MRENLTFEAVAAAADFLVAAGLSPTVRKVRERIGHGSNNTIGTYIKQWSSQHQQHIVPAATLPPPMQKTLLDEIARQVSAACGLLEKQLAEENDNMQMVLDESEDRRVKLDSVASELVVLETRAQRQDGQIDQLKTDLGEAREECRQERGATEFVRQALARAQLQMESLPRLQDELDKLRNSLEEQQRGRVEAEKIAAVAENSRASAECQLHEMRAREDALATKLEKARSELSFAADRERTLRDNLADARAMIGIRQIDIPVT